LSSPPLWGRVREGVLVHAPKLSSDSASRHDLIIWQHMLIRLMGGPAAAIILTNADTKDK